MPLAWQKVPGSCIHEINYADDTVSDTAAGTINVVTN